MKKSTKTYLLIAAVLGIWGTIGYQVLSGLSSDAPEVTTQDIDMTFSPQATTEKDTFSIQEVNRDPFLGTLTRRPMNRRPQTPKKVEEDMVWIPITYQGLVKRQSSSQQVFVVTINNQQHLLKKGQTINEVSLVRGSEEQIVVRYKNKQKTIPVQ